MALFLGEDSSRKYKVHPLVAFSILDHHKRRSATQKYVIGTLLGEYKGNELYITDSFAVPHDNGKPDHEHHQKMISMVADPSTVVGWYSTAGIRAVSGQVYSFYADQMDPVLPVHITVDIDMIKSHSLGVKGYLPRPLFIKNRIVSVQLQPIPTEVYISESEKFGVEAMLEATPESDLFDAPATLLTGNQSLELSLEKLLALVDTLIAYVADAEKKHEGKVEVGRAISNALSVIPDLDVDNFQSLVERTSEDLALVMKLAQLTRTQVAVADRLSSATSQ